MDKVAPTHLRKIGSSIAALGLLACVTPAQAAEVRTVTNIPSLLAGAKPGAQALPERLSAALGLDAESSFKVRSSEALPNNAGQSLRLDQTFRGVPIWNQQVVVHTATDGSVSYVGGMAVYDIKGEATPATPGISAARAVELARANVQGPSPIAAPSPNAINDKPTSAPATYNRGPLNFRNEETGLVYYLPTSGPLQLAYRVSFYADLVDSSGSVKPTRPVYFIDANSGATLYTYENIQHVASGTGPGGNMKTGQLNWGSSAVFPKFQVVDANPTCTLDDGAHVYSENLNHTTTGSQVPYSFSCYNNTYQTINGAFSPLNDAQSFGYALHNMYNSWYGIPPITQKLWLRVHYGNSYENAFWDGSSMAFGDGATTFYPLVGIDIMGHEVSHGFTEQHSNLTYANQSGGMNEAYSDMAGEALEHYYATTYGQLFPRTMPDYLVGAEIFKAAGQALRYMCDPISDGVSVEDFHAYSDALDVHYSSGIYNKAFCLLAKTTGWGPRKAFDVFVYANRYLWVPGSTMQSGADNVVTAAKQLGYSTPDVIAAFYAVGLMNAPDRFSSVLAGSLTASSPTMMGRESRNGIPSTCASVKAYAGDINPSTLYRYTTNTYTHPGPAACVTFTVRSGTCGPNGFLSIYSGAFNPANRATNFLADTGSSAVGVSLKVQLTAGQTVTLVLNGSVASGSATDCTMNVFADDGPRKVSHDFNGDGKSDIVWRDGAGNIGLWLMNGATISSSAGFSGNPLSYGVVGQRDFDGDGKTDLLWRGPNGETVIWLFNGLSATGVAVNQAWPTSWSAVGTGDFDGDGKGDILWRNTNGDIAIWLMNGATIKQNTNLGNLTTAYTIVAVGDFDGDGKADIMFKDTNAFVAFWLMNGTTVKSAAQYNSSIGLSWSIVGVGDFNGDGRADVLFRDTSSYVAIWLMNGLTVGDSAVYGPIGTAWSVVETGDYNYDGKADIVFRDTQAHAAVWYMNGKFIASSANLPDPGLSWNYVGQNAD